MNDEKITLWQGDCLDLMKNVEVFMNIDLRCGNCKDILRTLEDNSIDTLVTSPPYFNVRDYIQYNSLDDYMSEMKTIFSEVFRVLKNHHNIVVNVGDVCCQVGSTKDTTRKIPLGAMFIMMLQDIGFQYIDDYIWDKGEVQSNRQKGKPPYPYYQYPINCYEHILIFSKHVRNRNKIPCPICHQTIIRSDSSAKSDIQKWECSNPACPSKSKKGRGKRFSERTIMMSNYKTELNEIPKEFINQFRRDIVKITPVIKINNKGENKLGHTAPYPVAIPELAIRYFSGVNELVLDPFMGSGTTGVACLNLNRRFIGIELDENYFNIAQNRLLSNL